MLSSRGVLHHSVALYTILPKHGFGAGAHSVKKMVVSQVCGTNFTAHRRLSYIMWSENQKFKEGRKDDLGS
jgi:hypothetical protein